MSFNWSIKSRPTPFTAGSELPKKFHPAGKNAASPGTSDVLEALTSQRAKVPDNSNFLLRFVDTLSGGAYTLRTGRHAPSKGVGQPKPEAGTAERAPYPDLDHVLTMYDTEKHVQQSIMRMVATLVHEDERLKALRDDEKYRRPEEPLSIAEQKYFNKVKKRLTHDLVSLVPRREDTSSVYTENGVVEYKQIFGHVAKQEDGFAVKAGKTLDSDAIKYDQKARHEVKQDFNANQAVITQGDKLKLVRSGRTDTANKLEEQLLFGAAHTEPEKEGVVEYRSAIISAMDLGALKTSATRARRALTGKAEKGEVEREFLRAQQHAVTELFGDAPFIERQVDGKTVRLHRPLLFNFTLSAQAKSASNISLSRAYNEPATHALFDELAKEWECQGVGGDTTLAMRACKSDAERRAFLKGLDTRQIKHLSAKDRLALEFVKLTITKMDLSGDPYLKAEDPGKELLLLGHLLERTGISPHVQCKSGQDRTLNMVGTLIAADKYAKLHDQPLDPKEMHADMGLRSSYRHLYTNTVNDLGENPIRAVRGDQGKAKWGIKALGRGKHPWSAANYLPYKSKIGQNVNIKRPKPR